MLLARLLYGLRLRGAPSTRRGTLERRSLRLEQESCPPWVSGAWSNNINNRTVKRNKVKLPHMPQPARCRTTPARDRGHQRCATGQRPHGHASNGQQMCTCLERGPLLALPALQIRARRCAPPAPMSSSALRSRTMPSDTGRDPFPADTPACGVREIIKAHPWAAP